VTARLVFAGLALVSPSRTRATGLGTLISSWRTDLGGLVLTGLGAAVIAAYACALVANRRTKALTHLPASAAFVLGILVCLWAFCSGFGSLGDHAPAIVVADHLALITVAPVLLAFGAPLRRTRAAFRRQHGTRRRQRAAAIAAVAFHPAIAFGLLIGLEYVFLLSPVYGWTLRDQSGADLVRGAFLLAGCFYWWPIVGTDSWPRTMSGGVRMLDLAATLPFTAFLGIDLTLTDKRLPHSGSLEATHVAGAELWGCPTLFTLAALGGVFLWWMRQEDERAAALDAGLDTIDAAEAIVQAAEWRLDEDEDEDEDD
jgi:cytochrome c oxidase assembly factor CtaG